MITSSIIKSGRLILALLTLGITTLGISAGNFRPVSDEEIDSMGFDNAGISKLGIYVEDVITGEVLVDYNCADPFIPASVMKAITTASVITLINPSQHFDTRVELCGHVNDGHILEGNLVVRAVGDPTLESAYFIEHLGMADSIADRVYALGIDSIAGTVVVDESAMPFNGYPDGWAKEDYMWPYGTAYHTASWRDNRFTLSLPSKTAFPDVEGLEVKINKKKRGALKYHYDLKENVVTATGRFPRGAQTSVMLAHPDPAAAMRREIVDRLNGRGIAVGTVCIDESSSVETIYNHISPSLLEIMRSLMYRSDNMMAEAMLRAIAPGKPREEACRLEMSLWKLRGCDTDDVMIYDGSGLSRLNRLTPYFMADVLRFTSLSPRGVLYASLFPKAGNDGTVRNLFAASPLKGELALKSGTMKGVRCLVGFRMEQGIYPSHIIVVMANGANLQPAKLHKSLQVLFEKLFNKQQP